MKANKLYFRAWHKKNKEMHNVTGIAFGAKVVELSSPYDRNPVCKFDEVILMQGIEINGKVVYEGDIVRYSTSNKEDEIYSVEIYEGSFFFDGGDYGYYPMPQMDRLEELEVIGNIFED